MALDLYAFEMLTGQRLTPLPFTKAGWSIVTNGDGSITCTIPAKDPGVRKLGIWQATTLARNGLLAVVDDVPVEAGPIWKRAYNADEGTLELTAGGLGSYWQRRVLLPVAARTTSLVDLVTGDPNAALDTTLTGYSFGTIAKKWVELVRLWPNGAIPMTFPADEVGTRTRTVAAIDLKKLGALLEDIRNVERGPDIAFRPRWAANGLGIYWEMQTGTEAQPRLGSLDSANTRWTVGVPGSGAFGLEVAEDATALATQAWASGGGSADRVIVARSETASLTAAGFPILETVSSGHSDVKLQATMQEWADQGARIGGIAASFWKMNVRAREKGSPVLGDYWLGDMATVTVAPSEPVFPAGDYVRRIATISGDEKNESYPIVFAEATA